MQLPAWWAGQPGLLTAWILEEKSAVHQMTCLPLHTCTPFIHHPPLIPHRPTTQPKGLAEPHLHHFFIVPTFTITYFAWYFQIFFYLSSLAWNNWKAGHCSLCSWTDQQARPLACLQWANPSFLFSTFHICLLRSPVSLWRSHRIVMCNWHDDYVVWCATVWGSTHHGGLQHRSVIEQVLYGSECPIQSLDPAKSQVGHLNFLCHL